MSSCPQVREYASVYNELTERCFQSCVYSLSSRELTPQEVSVGGVPVQVNYPRVHPYVSHIMGHAIKWYGCGT